MQAHGVVLQMPGNEAGAVPCERIRKMYLKLAAVLIILTTGLNSANAFTAKVLKVYDGDSFKVLIEDNEVNIKLYGIDAPERGQDGNVSATRFLSRSLYQERLEIEVLNRDWAGQLHAIVTNLGNGTIVNAAMVANGYSWVQPHNCNATACEDWKKLESNARKYKLGIWSGFNLIPPWEFQREGN
jgi:micrococcal nuclease